MRLSARERSAVGVVCAGLALLALSSGAEGTEGGSTALRVAMLGVAVAVLLAGAPAPARFGEAGVEETERS
ncbi:hypothetical protein M877_14720 [Streptomyces niveus NCIMB 11891]|nr:hypothetical protein M877_14720 [Streptomyces niveus NCIMB 11891]